MLTYADVWQWDYMYECLRHLELGRAAVMPVPHTLRTRSMRSMRSICIRYASALRQRYRIRYARACIALRQTHTLLI